MIVHIIRTHATLPNRDIIIVDDVASVENCDYRDSIVIMGRTGYEYAYSRQDYMDNGDVPYDLKVVCYADSGKILNTIETGKRTGGFE